MLYPELFKQLESVRWSMEKNIPWSSFEAAQLTDEQAPALETPIGAYLRYMKRAI